MKTAFQAVVTLVALASIALAGAAGVHAADPTATPSQDLIGGALYAKASGVTLTSQSTVPVKVVMTADGPFTLTPNAFDLAPGETVEMAVAGDPSGVVSASLSVAQAAAGDTNGVVLEVAFPKPAPWTPPWHLILGALLAVALVVVVIVRARRFFATHAIVRKEP